MPETVIKNLVTAVSHSLLIYTAIFVPFQVSFISDYESDTINLIDEIVNNLFIVDFFLNFITAVEINGKIETKLKVIAREYFQTWLIIDLFACFPFDYITPILLASAQEDAGTVSDTNNLARLAKLPRFYRLIRVVRLLRLFKVSRNLSYIFHVLNI